MSVKSNLPDHNQFIPSEHLKTQSYLSEIEKCVDKTKMKLNPKKTKNMIFNFSNPEMISLQQMYKQQIQQESIEILNETKLLLLGTFIQSDLK